LRFVPVSSACVDDADDLSTLDEAHHEQSAMTRITDDELAIFAHGVIGVIFDAGNGIVERGLCFSERHSVLSEVSPFLRGVPVKDGDADQGLLGVARLVTARQIVFTPAKDAKKLKRSGLKLKAEALLDILRDDPFRSPAAVQPIRRFYADKRP
jgi:hypothetical protein